MSTRTTAIATSELVQLKYSVIKNKSYNLLITT